MATKDLFAVRLGERGHVAAFPRADVLFTERDQFTGEQCALVGRPYLISQVIIPTGCGGLLPTR